MGRNLTLGCVCLALLPFLTVSAAAQVSSQTMPLVGPAVAPLIAGANRVFVAAKSGNDANSCANVGTPCQTLAGAYSQVAAGGEVIVLESGGYGPLTITGPVAIDASAGVTAFIHPPSGPAITVSTGSSDNVTLRGLTLNVGSGNGISVTSVGTLNVVNCFITGFSNNGINMGSGGRLNLKGTDITGCFRGVAIYTDGVVEASVDHCHLDGNYYGLIAATTSPGNSTTTATYTTANNNINAGWWLGDGGSTGQDVINLEFCASSENGFAGLLAASGNALSTLRFSNCVIANNATYGLIIINSGSFQSRGNNTLTGSPTPVSGTLGSFSPM